MVRWAYGEIGLRRPQDTVQNYSGTEDGNDASERQVR